MACMGVTNGQAPTVGLVYGDTAVFDGYTVLTPLSVNMDNRTFLLNNCGEVIHEWPTQFNVGPSSYFLPNGDLLRPEPEYNQHFLAGGSAGHIKIIDWSGNTVWSYKISDSTVCHHHDVEYMPNGNILVLAWIAYDSLECISRGRDTSLIEDGVIWSEKLIEITPTGPGTGTVVWEWDVWDHLIQQADSTKPDYGNPADYPGRWHLNYTGTSGADRDWLHFNAIAYNPTLDQIALSSRNWDEIYIIDHGTTTQEAAGHSGGAYGKGGDILYRWGNPEAYAHGTPADKTLFGQHNVQWIPDTMPQGGRILVFNNGDSRLPVPYSTIDIFIPPVDSLNNYIKVAGMPFGPDSAVWSYAAPNPTDFYSKFIAGVQPLDNGNLFICNGTHGTLFEITPGKDLVWKYISPMTSNDLVNQGDTLLPHPVHGTNNWVFRALKYAPDYSGFLGKTFNNTGPLELNPWPTACVTSVAEQQEDRIFRLYPNPTRGIMYLENSQYNMKSLPIVIRDITGRVLDKMKVQRPGSVYSFQLRQASGVYLVEVGQGRDKQVFRVIKH